MSRVRVPSPAPFFRWCRVKIKNFLSSVFFLFIGFIFIIKFVFYPLSSFVLQKEFGIFYDFESPHLALDGTFTVKNLVFSYQDSLSAKSGTFSFSIGKKFSGLFKNHVTVKSFELIDTKISLDTKLFAENEKPAENTEDLELPTRVPFFPLEEINIKNLDFEMREGEKVVFSTKKVSLAGNELYRLDMPEVFIASNSVMKRDISLGVTFDFTAEDKNYAINSLKVNSELFSINAEQPQDNHDLSAER